MAEYLHPGVYTEEKSSGVKPIEGAGTSTAGFIGITAKGVPNKATFITSWAQFVRHFGYLIPGSYLPYAVQQFFANGGKRCYVVRVLSAVSSAASFATLSTREANTPARPALKVKAKGNGAWGDSLAVLVQDGSTNPMAEFKLIVMLAGEPVEVFDNLSMDPAAENYVETEVNDASDYIQVEDLHPATELANGQPVHATAFSTAALPATPITFAAGDVITLTGPDGATSTVDFGALTQPVPPAEVLSRLGAAWGPFNVTVSLSTAADGGTVGRVKVRHSMAGYEHYFSIAGQAATAGALAGLATAPIAQGKGAAIGATVKSAVSATGFNITAATNGLQLNVNGEALPAVALTVGATVGAGTLANDINAILDTDGAGRLVKARAEGNRLVISTTNRGNANNNLLVSGTAAPVLNFRQLDGSAIPGAGSAGFGRSEAAFIQSDEAPFSVEENANFRLAVNNGALGATVKTVFVTFTTGADFQNLEKVTAKELADKINATVAAGTVVASVVGNTVVIRQARKGNYYTLAFEDGQKDPNIKLGFDGQVQRGYADGDAGSPYFRPAQNLVGGANEPWPLDNGTDGSPVSNFDLIGTADKKTGLHALDDVRDVNFIAIPGATDPGVIGDAVGYCSIRQDCFFIADAPGKRDKLTPTTEPAHAQDFLRNKIKNKTSYGALYYPWLEIPDPVGAGRNPRRFVPPSGFIAGLYARIDTTRGVWKAPAGTEANLIGPIGLEYSATDSEQDILNPIGVNCVRDFPASGIVVWGARTLATQSDPEYRYIPVRRYTIYLRVSIYNGTQWAVFEPNDAPLWEALKANIEDFLMGEFRKGALAGATPEEAFEVQCDADLNPPSEVNAGRVNMEVRFAPLKPAEFVIIRISQKTQRPQG
jgi:phage tail sheath protein FI